jgi:hypothetical protein
MPIVSLLQITWMFLMRKYNLLRGFASLAILAGSILSAVQAEAKSDFDALLADVNFGAANSAIEEATSVSASDQTALTAIQSPPAELGLPEPDAAPMTMPQTPVQPLPAAPLVDHPVTVQPSVPGTVAQASAADCGCQCGGQCGHGSKHPCRVSEGYCQPYTPPQLPTSTFYQYWRSNPCNVNVWDGFRNRCHKNIDLTIHHGDQGCLSRNCGGNCGGCSDCGPAPAEWCGKGNCDMVPCDGQ